MRRLQFIQLDVFTHTPFGGNQLAVFPKAEELSETEMQAIAREMNYSETTFVVPASDAQALCRVRIFTPQTELPFAGHPVVGTTFALARAGRIHDLGSPIYLQLGVGTLPVDVLYEERRPSFVWMHQPIPRFEAWRGEREALAAAIGVAPGDFAEALPIERGSAGVPFVYVPLRSREAVARAQAGPQLGEALGSPSSGPFAGHPAVYVFSLQSPTDSAADSPSDGADVHARMFAPELGVVEDAATGSAAGPLGVYLVRHGVAQPDMSSPSGDARIRLEQGVEMGRPSRIDIDIEVAVAGEAQTIRDVRVGGEAVVIAEGELYLP
jgi:trans-2,3-dihydro-3-hydroxyanthranilate isomerase